MNGARDSQISVLGGRAARFEARGGLRRGRALRKVDGCAFGPSAGPERLRTGCLLYTSPSPRD
eukprot:10125261-Alexandrium_andersonii.AAC.1